MLYRCWFNDMSRFRQFVRMLAALEHRPSNWSHDKEIVEACQHMRTISFEHLTEAKLAQAMFIETVVQASSQHGVT